MSTHADAQPRPRVSVVLFPGSNCDRDAVEAVESVIGADARLVWYEDHDLYEPDLVLLPGGFSYGDYLRSGAMARFAPVMSAVMRFALEGGAVLGVCNGFQVLCEAGLLPGAMLRNRQLRFACREVTLRVETKRTPFTLTLKMGERLRMPIAHGEGCWTVAPEVYADLVARDQVVFRYVDAEGEATEDANPNGSLGNVAGISNLQGNVVGMMPHPERACDELLGSVDGAKLFRSFAAALLGMGEPSYGFPRADAISPPGR